MGNTSNASGSGAVRRSLGRKLLALRESAGRSAADVAGLKLASRDKLWRIEHGRSPVKQGDVLALCRYYKASPEETDPLVELALKTDAEAYWEQYKDLMPPRLGVLIETEGSAFQVRTYDPLLVYGLLQTPAYHRAIAEADDLSPEAIDRQVELRTERQRAAFDRQPPLEVIAILDQGAIGRKVGGQAVMKEQVQHLLQMSELPNVRVLVLPWDAGAHVAMRGAFTILSSEEDNEATDVVYLESLGVGRLEEKGPLVKRYCTNFARVLDQSITIEEYVK